MKRLRKATIYYSMLSQAESSLLYLSWANQNRLVHAGVRRGVMILERVAGRTFIPADQVVDLCRDLEFVARADEN